MNTQLPPPQKTRSPSNLPARILRVFLAAFAIIAIAFAAFLLLRAGIFYLLYTTLFARVSELTGLDLWPTRAVTLAILTAVWFFPWSLLFRPWIWGAKKQIFVLAIFLIPAVAVMHFVTRDVYFSREDGRPLKYYIQSLDGYKFAASPGIDPVYGISYKPVTARIASLYFSWKRHGPNAEDPAPEYFNPATGEPLRWYAETPDGKIDVFPLPGFHPIYGIKLRPATEDAVARYRRQEKEREEAMLKTPLGPGRYLLVPPQPSGAVDGLCFILTEVDLTSTSMLVHLNAEAKDATSVSAKIIMLLPDGSAVRCEERRLKEGDLTIFGDSFIFYSGRHGSVVLEFPKVSGISAFTIAANDQPLISANLHNATFRSY